MPLTGSSVIPALPAFRKTSPIPVPSSTCFSTNAIWALIASSPPPSSGHHPQLEFSSSKRPRIRKAGQCRGSIGALHLLDPDCLKSALGVRDRSCRRSRQFGERKLSLQWHASPARLKIGLCRHRATNKRTAAIEHPNSPPQMSEKLANEVATEVRLSPRLLPIPFRLGTLIDRAVSEQLRDGIAHTPLAPESGLLSRPVLKTG